MPYTLSQIPYACDALKPHIDARTMEIHPTQHHQADANHLNAALAGTPQAELPVAQRIAPIDALPEGMRAAVRNNGGGHANHSLFWQVMSQGGGAPTGDLAQASDADLGGFEAFQNAFTQAALSRFGSGWAWLTVNAQGKLALENSANPDSPLGIGAGNTPILGLAVWEHADCLRDPNRRPAYIAALYNVVNWPDAARRDAEAR